MDDEERSQYLHYIHNWHSNAGTEEVTVTIAEMEKFIMNLFFVNFRLIRDKDDPGPEIQLFYHDFMERDLKFVMKIATARSFHSRSRLSVRRVLGCGHFILSVIYLQYNELERRLGDNWAMADLWRTMREDLFEKKLLSTEEPCDHVSVYQWLHALYQKVFELMPVSEVTEYLRIPFTLLRVTGPCELNQDDTSDDFMRNYQEFLVFCLHNMHELGLLRAKKDANKQMHLQQYYRLVRKLGMPPPTWLPMSSRFRIQMRMQYYLEITHIKIRHVVKVETSTDYTMRKITGAVQREKQFAITRKSQTQPEDGGGRGGPPNQLSLTWHKVPNWRNQMATWHRVSNDVSVKVIGIDWKLGCGGCPKTPQRLPIKKTGRKRLCKWITIRRLVLVRRMVWRRTQWAVL